MLRIKKGCKICGNNTKVDFVKLTDLYCSYFVPDRVGIEYETLNNPMKSATFWFLGQCPECGEEMRAGSTCGITLSPISTIEYLWREFRNYRPYEGYNEVDGRKVYACDNSRTRWYELMFEDLTLAETQKMFIRMFRKEDRVTVAQWIADYNGKSTVKSAKERYTELRKQGIDEDGWILYEAAVEITRVNVYTYFYAEDNRGYFEEADGNKMLRWLEIAKFADIEWDCSQPPYEKYSSHSMDKTTREYAEYEAKLYALALEKATKVKQ